MHISIHAQPGKPPEGTKGVGGTRGGSQKPSGGKPGGGTQKPSEGSSPGGKDSGGKGTK